MSQKHAKFEKLMLKTKLFVRKNELFSLHMDQCIIKISIIFNNLEIEQVHDPDSNTSNAAFYYSNLNIHA